MTIINGTPGSDRLQGGNDADTLYGHGGDDTFVWSAGWDYYWGGSGYDIMDLSARPSGLHFGYDNGDPYSLWSYDGSGWFFEIERFIGTAYGDVIVTSNIDTTINGGGGNDQLHGAGGNDIFYGDQGNDYLSGGNGRDTLYGGDDNDQLFGGNGNDYLLGGNGTDMLRGGAGSDVLDGGAGVDTADYSDSGAAVHVDLSEDSRFYGGFGTGGDAQDDVLFDIENIVGSAHNDMLKGSNNVDNRLEGGSGDDWLDGRGGNDVLIGGAGNDTLIGGAGADRLEGGSGIDHVNYSASAAGVTVNLITGIATGGDAQGDVLIGIENVTGTRFDDTLTGTYMEGALRGGNMLDGGAGNDRITGGSGGDHIYGGNGNDTLDGGAGWDSLYGGEGDDTFLLSTGGDSYWGDAGFDTVDLSAQNGRVTITYEGNPDSSRLNGNDAGRFYDIERFIATEYNDIIQTSNHATTIEGLGGNDYLTGGAGNDTFYGGDDYDTLSGGDGNDGLDGGNHNDELLGGAGNDILLGGAGNDTLIGGTGADYLEGGTGVDVYMWQQQADLGDTIRGFETHDRLMFSAAEFGFQAGHQLQLGIDFFVGQPITGSAPAFSYSSGNLLWDADGAGGAAARAVAFLTSRETVSQSNFVFV